MYLLFQAETSISLLTLAMTNMTKVTCFKKQNQMSPCKALVPKVSVSFWMFIRCKLTLGNK